MCMYGLHYTDASLGFSISKMKLKSKKLFHFLSSEYTAIYWCNGGYPVLRAETIGPSWWSSLEREAENNGIIFVILNLIVVNYTETVSAAYT